MKFRYIFILLAVTFVILAVYNGGNQADDKYKETKEMIVLRKMVHELLLSSGDSISRVLPVKQVSVNEYHLSPEKPLAINPDSFVNIVNRTVSEGKLPVSFTANVVRKQDEGIVYGFVASPSPGEREVSCLGRNLPQDDYYISFIFPPSTTFPWSSYLFWGSMAVALTGFLFWLKKKKDAGTNTIPVPEIQVEEKETPVEEDIKNGPIRIGSYLFDPHQQQLELDGQRTTLTIKESKVLHILASAPNTIVERDTLQKEVWENEGVIVTRSLDMFISKLRKKLHGDPDVKIVNAHGKGYKLSVAEHSA